MKHETDAKDIDRRLHDYATRWRASQPDPTPLLGALASLDTTTAPISGLRRWYTATITIAAGLALTIGVASVAHHRDSPVTVAGPGEKPGTASTPNPSSQSTARQPLARPCTASDLRVARVNTDPAASTLYTLVHLRNASPTSCSLGEKPVFLQAMSNRGNPLLNYSIDTSGSGPRPGNVAPGADNGLLVFATSAACPAPEHDASGGDLRYSHISIGLGQDRGILEMPPTLELVGTCGIDISRPGVAEHQPSG